MPRRRPNGRLRCRLKWSDNFEKKLPGESRNNEGSKLNEKHEKRRKRDVSPPQQKRKLGDERQRKKRPKER